MSDSNTTGPTSELVFTDRDEQLLAYDGLPKAFRALIDSLPENPDAREFVQVIERWGEANALILITQALRGRYPGWEPPR